MGVDQQHEARASRESENVAKIARCGPELTVEVIHGPFYLLVEGQDLDQLSNLGYDRVRDGTHHEFWRGGD